MFILDTSEQSGSAPKVKIQTHRAMSNDLIKNSYYGYRLFISQQVQSYVALANVSSECDFCL